MDLPRLRRLLGGPETAWLLERVRARIADGRPLDTSVVLGAGTPEQRRAVELLLGRRNGRGRSLSVPLGELDRMLRESEAAPDGLAAAVVALTGPVPDRRAEREADEQAWSDAVAPLDGWTGELAGLPALDGWRSRVESTGLLRRLSSGDPLQARELARQAARVLSVLPLPVSAEQATTLAVLAARATGDAHALDHGRPLGTLLRSALRVWCALPEEETAGAEGRRAVWAAAGVASDELSSRVLTLGLPGGAGDPTARVLAVAAEAGEPCVLTLRQCARPEAELDLGVAGRRVFLCENPAVVAEAARALGPACPPLVCVEGNVSVAARSLLSRLVAQGASPVYHGDFDWGGLRIAGDVLRLTDARPWRYTRADYLDAVGCGLGTPLTTGTPAPSPWDPGLAEAVSLHRIRVEEEQVIDHLVADLRESATD